LSITGDEFRQLIQPTIEGLGFELCDLEMRLGERQGIIRVFIDRVPAGISLDDCETVSRQISALLDVEDLIPGRYSLEVSSPGLDRRLTKTEHYQRFRGEIVRVKLRFPVQGRRNFRGKLVSAGDKDIEVEVDGTAYRLPMATIESTRLIPTV